LDMILGYYNIDPASVKREFLPISDIGPAIRHHKIVAALAVGPIGPGNVVDVVASIAKATKGTPGILEIEEGDAIAKQFPAFESIDIPEGAFRGRPPTPDDTVKGLAVSYRFVVPLRMLDIVAAAIARSIIKTKSNLMAVTPTASQIEAPDTDSENPLLPIHPGVAAYLTNGDQSFFDPIAAVFLCCRHTVERGGLADRARRGALAEQKAAKRTAANPAASRHRRRGSERRLFRA
ncbi:MAG TPA: TAXI family TRAP transporter solute-binding subunit, partial [Methylocella sp.]|nr:TAXI family TRAP transporter solute-binding subunit [Methylocella sp.]